MRIHDDGVPLLPAATKAADPRNYVSSLNASFSLVKSILGAGSFALPWAFVQSGYILGPLLLIFMASLSHYTMTVVIRCHRLAVNVEPSVLTYVDIARAAFGAPGALSCYVASLCSSVGKYGNTSLVALPLTKASSH